MKKLLFLLSILLLTSASLLADKKDVSLKPVTPADGKTLVPNPPIGKRSPSRLIQCTIDTDQKSITIDYDADIVAYELWNIEGTVKIYESMSDYDAVEFMKTVQGEYQLCLVSDEFIYIGHIDL